MSMDFYRTPLMRDTSDDTSVFLTNLEWYGQILAWEKLEKLKKLEKIEARQKELACLLKTTEGAKISRSYPNFGRNPTPHDESQVFEIPSVLAGRHTTNALGDSGAKWNFMKEEFAKREGFSIDRKTRKDIKIGSGKAVTTTGTIQTTFRFKGENEEYPLIFHLLSKCIHDVILGNPFLKATKTFTSNIRRVKERLLKSIRHRHLLYLGNSGPRFSGLVNGIPQEALADSGAQVAVMDEAYALRIGLSIIDDEKHCTRLRFADNSAAYTSGMVYGVEWEFGPGGISEKYKLDFHILKNAPADVILNDSFLFGANAFSKYDCYLTDENDEDEEAYFFVISIDMRHKNEENLDMDSLENKAHCELIRRGEEEDRIENLPVEKRDAAWAAENERRAQWNRGQTSLQLNPERVSSSTPPSGASSPPSTSTPLTTSSNDAITQGGARYSAPIKRFRWRFKLKRKQNA